MLKDQLNEIRLKREYYQEIGKNFLEAYLRDAEKLSQCVENLDGTLDLFGPIDSQVEFK
jgi:hypothetical protein